MVTQQAKEALTTDSAGVENEVKVVHAVAACLCEHFRCASAAEHILRAVQLHAVSVSERCLLEQL